MRAWLGVGGNCAGVFGVWESLSQRQVKASSLSSAVLESILAGAQGIHKGVLGAQHSQ